MSRRDRWFDERRAAIRQYYLADPENPYQQAGRSTGARRWEDTRRPIADGIVGNGSFLDVGCANGLLVECLMRWLEERGVSIEPHGLDFVSELLALARTRVPTGTFHLGNAWDWEPPQRYAYVRTNIEYVPPDDRAEFILRQHAWLERGGRMILCHYPDPAGERVDVPGLVAAAGLELGGVLRQADHIIVWIAA